MINNILHNALLASNKKNKFDRNTPLTFTAVEADSAVTFDYNFDNYDYTSGLMYKTNSMEEFEPYTDTVNLTNVGDWVQFKNTDINPENLLNSSGIDDNYAYYYSIGRFSMAGLIEGSGNIQSLLNFVDYCTPYCYYDMFYGCRSLTKAPDLPATNLADGCYYSMFYGCRSLTKAPDLPATTLAPYCYDDMFEYCTSLSSAPDLPATKLSESCYSYMFANCTSLEFDFELFLQRHKNSNLAKSCFHFMVYGCTKVNENRTLIPIDEWREKYNTNYAYGCYDGLYTGCTAITEIPANYLTSICNSTTDCSMLGFRGWFSRLY